MPVYGDTIEANRRLTFLDLGAYTANTAVIPAARFGCPPGVKGIRIIGLHIMGSAIPNDPDGVLLVNVDVNDISEGATDVLVSAADMETLLVAANKWYELTQESDSSEFIFTLEPGDVLSCDLTSDSGAITTNPNLTLCIEWHNVPDYDNSHLRVQNPADYGL